MKNQESEKDPLLGSSSHSNKVPYSVSEKADTTTHKPHSDREASWHQTLPGQRETDYETNRSDRYLPRYTPEPLVYLGYCCSILAGLCFTSSNVMIKYIPEVNSWQLLLVRCLAQLATMVPIMLLGKHNIFGTPDFATRWRLVAQGVLGGFLLLGIFVAVARMPLGDCTAIFFSSPAFTMVR